MLRLIIALILLIFCLKSDADTVPGCDFSKVPKQADGCIEWRFFKKVAQGCEIQEDVCFSIPIIESPSIKQPAKPAYFEKEKAEDRARIVSILNVSATALVKNPKMKDVSIVLFDKDGKFTDRLQKDAEKYLLDKGVAKDQFKIKIVRKVGD